MCGIGGFSLSAGSKINSRQLANALLTALEDRGGMASGIAWQTRDGGNGYYKAAVNGASLKLKAMPKHAPVAIVHTRLATHGSTTDNRNNHPVLSPERSIALVHNGVIYNHDIVREGLPEIPFDVDTAVIPALIEADPSLDRLRELDGDAAIGWLSDANHGTLNLARLEHSPMTIAQLDDGSFVFASTEALLWRVLIQLDLMPDFMKSVPEYTLLRVKDGVIAEWSELQPSKAMRKSYDYNHYRHLTAGGKQDYAYSPYGSEWDPYWSDPDSPSYYSMGYQDGYDYDDMWDDVETKAWNESFDVAPDSGDSEYYIQYQTSIQSEPHYIWYHKSEHAIWRQDLFLIKADAVEYKVVDYGHVDKNGLLMSEMAGSPNTSCTLDMLNDEAF